MRFGSISRARLLIAAAIVLALLVAWVAPMRAGEKTVTAHFPQTVSLFEGSDVTIMGVSVGRVKQIVPEGDSVKVVMTYSDEYKLPADVKAAIVTPTLVADRFVQLVPAYAGGAALPDNGDIPLARSVVPIEIDRIYRSLLKLTKSLGPQGANKDGALGRVLASTADSLEGNGELGNQAIADLASAARSLGDNSPELFATVEALAGITDTLAKNDDDMVDFLDSLAEVSEQLEGESDELEEALEAIARAVTITQSFVKDNRELLTEDLKRLTRTLRAIAIERESLKTTLEVAPLGLTNLALSFDAVSVGAGIRLQITPMISDLGNVLCAVVTNAGIPNPTVLCQLLKALIPATPTIDQALPPIPGIVGPTPATSTNTPAPTTPTTVDGVPVGGAKLVEQIQKLLAGAP
jgi:phospholipid/cholesterol/gamma-HCH transport system substrate-binding protein